MKKTFFAISIILIAILMLVVSNCAFAANLEAEDSTITIVRHVNDVAGTVSNQFTYTITAAETNPSTVEGMPTTATVVFDAVGSDAEFIATAEGVIDLSNINFDTLGDYEFTVTETASSDDVNYPVDADQTYTIRVEVRNEVDENGNPTGNLVATKFLVNESVDPKEKAEDLEFEETAKKTGISLTKTVSGDLADTTKYFEFTVTVEGESDEEFTVSGGSHEENPTVIVANTATTVYLKSGETLKIGEDQIRVGSEYSFTETDSGEGYTTNITLGDGTAKTETLETGAQIADVDATKNAVTFENVKESSTSTGVFFSIAPYVGIILLAIILIAVFRKISQQNNEE